MGSIAFTQVDGRNQEAVGQRPKLTHREREREDPTDPARTDTQQSPIPSFALTARFS